MLIAGIDPGLSGAIAIWKTESSEIIDLFDTPTFVLARNAKKKREVDVTAFAEFLGARLIGHAFLEQVGAMPNQGVSSVFAFGKAYGILIGILAAHKTPISYVHPRVWKKDLVVPAEKDGARARASQLMPNAATLWRLVKHDGRAEAALLAYWGACAMQKIAAGYPNSLGIDANLRRAAAGDEA